MKANELNGGKEFKNFYKGVGQYANQQKQKEAEIIRKFLNYYKAKGLTLNINTGTHIEALISGYIDNL